MLVRMSLLLILLSLLAAQATAPATRPAAYASEPFKVVHRHEAGADNPAGLPVPPDLELHFADGHMLMVDADGAVVGTYRLDGPAAFLSPRGEVLPLRMGLGWAELRREEVRDEIRREGAEDQRRWTLAMLFPAFRIEDLDGGGVRVASEFIDIVILPRPATADRLPTGAAVAYAQAYRLTAMQKATSDRNPVFVFGPMVAADVMAGRDLLPGRIEDTLRGPSGQSSTMITRLEVAPLSRAERERVWQRAAVLAELERAEAEQRAGDARSVPR